MEELKAKENEMELIRLDGANMDIDLVSKDKIPWNEVDKTDKHKCCVKNISICPYFCGIEYLDNVLCCYPNKNKLVNNKIKK